MVRIKNQTVPKRDKMKRLCKNKIPSHKEANKIPKQLKVNPEVCDDCNIKKCTYALYLYGNEK